MIAAHFFEWLEEISIAGKTGQKAGITSKGLNYRLKNLNLVI